MLRLAKKYNSFVAFQPLKVMYKGIKDLGPISPTKTQFKKTITFIKKMKNNPKWKNYMRNSTKGLEHIGDWPKYKKLKCNAGDIFLIIMPNGDVVPCDRIKDTYKEGIPNYLDVGMKEAFENLPSVKCAGCGFCGALELNYISNLKKGGISEIQRVLN